MLLISAMMAHHAYAAEYMCEIKGMSTAYYDSNPQMHSFSPSKTNGKERYILGNDNRVAYYDNDTSEWIWDELTVAHTKKGDIYYSFPDEGGVITVLFNKDRTKVLSTYSNDEGGISSYTYAQECIEI